VKLLNWFLYRLIRRLTLNLAVAYFRRGEAEIGLGQKEMGCMDLNKAL